MRKNARAGNLYEAVMNYLRFKDQCERDANKGPQVKLPEMSPEARARLDAAIKNYVDAVIAEARQGGKHE